MKVKKKIIIINNDDKNKCVELLYISVRTRKSKKKDKKKEEIWIYCNHLKNSNKRIFFQIL